MIYIVTALAAEAKPLITHYRLQHQRNSAFPLYESATISLVISGVGVANAAAATAYLGARSNATSAAWLNIGIAGHSNAAVGEVFLANKISNCTSGECWYPPQILGTQLARTNLFTVPCVETKFANAGLYDMEASGFFSIACRFSTAELVQCVKIVADNPTTPASIDAKRTTSLVHQACTQISDAVDALIALRSALPEVADVIPHMTELLANYRCSHAQYIRLKQLLQQAATLGIELDKQLYHCPSTTALLDALSYQMSRIPLRLDV